MKAFLIGSILFSFVAVGSASPFTLYENETDPDTINVTPAGDAGESQRRLYLRATVGLAEIFEGGIGYQIDNTWAIGVKYGAYWLGGGLPHADGGIGLRISQNTYWSILNTVNYEVVVLPNREKHSLSGGFAAEINVGHENRTDPGIHFVWSMGISAAFSAYTPLILPNLKCGMNLSL